ncbi:MAG: GMC family oxidoreductase [Planctomycetota bacterium]|nr:GMC family oxidoreductase [Planctomycetota bacterium]
MQSSYDIIIIGTGAGGGTIAHALAPSGKRILILERGDFLPRERENWDEKAVFADKRYLAKERWFDKDDQPFEPYTHYWVGGNTKVYGAALLRLRARDFDRVEHFGGISPAWPIGYDIFEPYYSRAERLYSAHGQRGSDPCEPPASAPYPHPALGPEPRIRDLFDDFVALGYRPFPAPLGVRLDPRDAPYRFSTFDGYPDLTEVKSDSHVVAVRPVLARSNVTLMTRALVERLVVDRSGGSVAEVLVDRDGEKLRFRADLVILAAGAINSAALLLRSRCDSHPTGLANSSGLVGRNYMCHQNGCFIAVTQEPNPSAFQKHFAISDFYHSAPDSPFPLGLIQLMGKPDSGTLAWLKGDDLPNVSVDDIKPRTIDFFLSAEDLPSPDNRVTLRDDGSIRVSYTPNNTEAYDRLQAKLARMLEQAQQRRGHAPPHFLAKRLGVSGVSHQNGTLRFGVSARDSVLDLNCKAHDLDNLYVCDGSFFPSCGAVNPSLTIMANALRVADHILGRLHVEAAPVNGSTHNSFDGITIGSRSQPRTTSPASLAP